MLSLAIISAQEWDVKSKGFSSFRRAQEERQEMSGLKLNALLITPVQRIPRWVISNNYLNMHSIYSPIFKLFFIFIIISNRSFVHFKFMYNYFTCIATSYCCKTFSNAHHLNMLTTTT